MRSGEESTPLVLEIEPAYTAAMLDAPVKTLLPFSAVVFDMDGTLLDTEPVFRDVAFEVCERLGFVMTHDVHIQTVGASGESTHRLMMTTYGETLPYELFAEQCKERMHERMEEAVPVKPGVHELLAELQARQIPLAVATSSRSRHALGHLGRAGLVDRFATIVTRDDVANPKPHPEPYLLAATRLGVDPRTCLAVEDSHAGVRAAHAAGMQTIMVPDLLRPTDEIAALCAHVMESLHHLREIAFRR
jgi:HAD superfamily hydrolase (TIGR01509 family)